MAMNVRCGKEECDYNAGGDCDYAGDIELIVEHYLGGHESMSCEMFENSMEEG